MSDIATLESVWESLAQRDALHAILTDETKAGGKWDVAEFMATGNAEIETVLRHLAELSVSPTGMSLLLTSGTASDGLLMLFAAISLPASGSISIVIRSDSPRQGEQIGFENKH